ncbi:S-adenosyl-L-methionine-dependent methyltransferase [Microdochium bolleyi]|uniref:S-adenosyl-L-methionine-dependent methyltransferase n=1 Tax=Microdochium bolleyi TaxID=196109 RepID=A0A136JC21_9PEZI|nr:S-adenosyl-L-methionine-dependent methyltransferase [Microdochium bolleyi]
MAKTPEARSQRRRMRTSVPNVPTIPPPPNMANVIHPGPGGDCSVASPTTGGLGGSDGCSNNYNTDIPLATTESDSDDYDTATAEPPVPELVNDFSTTELTDVESSIDIVSPSSASMTGSDHIGPALVPVEEYASRQNDAVSIFHGPVETRPVVLPSAGEESGSDGHDDQDDGSTILSTRSVNPQDLPYVTENGRLYCGDYYMPIDELELDRLYLFHQVYLQILDSQLTTATLEEPTHILDIGTGSGDWAMDIAEQFPDCEVTGTDIAGVFQRRAPMNCFWEVDDAEFAWERHSDHYDLVHLRNMDGAFRDWRFVYESAYRCLKPGGWIEIMDFVDHHSSGGSLSHFKPTSQIHRFMTSLDKAAEMSGKPRGAEHLEPRMLYEAGYIDVRVTDYSIPLKLNDGGLIGKTWLVAQIATLEALGLRLLTTHLQWTADEVREAANSVKEELLGFSKAPGRSSAALRTRVLLGRKPQGNVRWSVNSTGMTSDWAGERATSAMERPQEDLSNQ